MKMVEPTGPEVVVDERTKALNNYRRKLAECRDIEQKLKDLRNKESEQTKQFDKSENDIKREIHWQNDEWNTLCRRMSSFDQLGGIKAEE
ncbi:hypothetical protein CRE_14692 [Caenorhabditis remanei]|uniref:Uncharacterized protein n=1 Tax=Caenorhabditis remanei TaxID=31234 RepID=E3M9L9_CAERE|nr:hypothetical protein CRE_14692 [Caenorhabditis remanei]